MDLEGILAGAGIYVVRWLWRLMPGTVYRWRPFRPLMLMGMSPELRRAMEILQTDGRQYGRLGDTERGWGAARIIAKKLDQLDVEHPSVEADELAWRWWSFVTCLIPHAEAKDISGARRALSEMESIADPHPGPWGRADASEAAEPPATDDERPQ